MSEPQRQHPQPPTAQTAAQTPSHVRTAHQTSPRRHKPGYRDPAQATRDRCFSCLRLVPTRSVQVYGEPTPRAVPLSFPHEVLGVGNQPVTVWYCEACARTAVNARNAAQSDGGTAR